MNGLDAYSEDSIYIEGIESNRGLQLPGTGLAGSDLIPIPRSRVLPPLSEGSGSGDLPEITEITIDSASFESATEESIDPLTGAAARPPEIPQPTRGYIETGSSGEIKSNFLLDDGQLDTIKFGLYSLEGMETYQLGSTDYQLEAARRINSNSPLGVEIINDSIQASRFYPEGRSYNFGEYEGEVSFQLMPHAKYGVMLMYSGSWQEFIDDIRPWRGWLFLEYGDSQQRRSKQIVDPTGDGTLIGLEDIVLNSSASDRDYNDIIFQITGAKFFGYTGDELINPENDWRSEPLGQEIIDYALGQIAGEEEPPVIEGTLANDTGASNTDGLTNDATITGTVTDESSVVAFRAGFEPDNKTSALAWLAENGSYQLAPSALETINGEALSDGDYTLYLEAEDAFGNIASHEIAFSLDRSAPTLAISSPTEGAELTPGATLAGTVDEELTSLSYSFDELSENPIAESSGAFETVLDLSSLEPGSSYTLKIKAADLAGNETEFDIEVSIPAEDNDVPEIAAALANDSGSSSTDGLTSDATITGTVTDSGGSVVSLRAGFGEAAVEDYLEISDALDSSGNFTLDRAALEEILANPLADGSYELHLIATDDSDNTSETFTLSFNYDSTAPELNLLTPLAEGNHSNTARLIGSAADSGIIAGASYSLNGSAFSSLPIAGDGSFDSALANPSLSLGDHQITVQIQDAAGNETSSVVNFAVTNDFATGATGSTGWGAANSETIILSDRDSLFSRTAIPVELGQTEGSRTLKFQLEKASTGDQLGAADIFQVYLVSASDLEQTLLDGGQPGTAVFSLMGETAEFIPGLVRYDGTTVEIDLSSLGAESSGQLIFKAINNNPDSASVFQVKSLSNIADPEGFVGPVFPIQLQPVSPGPAIDTSSFTSSSDLEIILGQVRLDEATGNYTANLQIRNNGEAVGRNAAISFPDLPSGVSLQNASGIDASGNPYINLGNGIDSSGLDRGETSAPVEVILANPNLVEFSLTGEILIGGANIAPTFEAIGALSVMPGSKLEVPLVATDPEGETVTFQIQSDEPLPTGKLEGNGTLVFTPTPEEIGSYTFNLIATDGGATTTQEVTLIVEADPVTTTRVSGTIENTAQEPLAGVVVELGGLQAVTAADGTFTIEAAGSLPDDTLKVRGENIPGPVTYPFIAEKLPLVLERDAYSGYNNVISRPIYLPPIDTANAQTIDPFADVTVTTAAIPGAAVEVAAGSLLDQQGNPYTGELSITAVPNDLTPAALPPNLSPDLVVTIQPGEMEFTEPAPLTLPNLAGYAPGTEMDLWSINPITGDFDNVGGGVVSADGSIVETICGGIRNSSWHFFAPPPPPPNNLDEDPRNSDDRCEECQAEQEFTSTVELHSGAVLETHNLVSYQSLGSSRGVTLSYDSERADPRPILHFGYRRGPANNSHLVADLTVSRGAFSYQIPGFAGGEWGVPGGEHFWSVPQNGGAMDAALQIDLRSMPSGQHDYSLNSGFRIFNGSLFAGTSANSTGKIISVNSIESAFGAGWSIAGWQELVENPDGSVLLIDGDGSELLFEAPETAGEAYISPPGDYSVLQREASGTFRRIMKDQTTYSFNAENKIALMSEANGNSTQYLYNASGDLASIVDPAGLETTFTYTGTRVSAITDPSGRATYLQHDAAGNLTQITDPDSASRNFEYDSGHHIISETDKRGNREQTFYDFAGRANRAIRKDGTELQIAPIEVQGLYRSEETSDPFDEPPVAKALSTPWVGNNVKGAQASYADANGNVVAPLLDQAGQVVSSQDGAGNLPSVERDNQNRVTERRNARGHVTSYEYDEFGNVTLIADSLSGQASEPDPEEELFAQSNNYQIGWGSIEKTALADIDGDSDLDIISTDKYSANFSVSRLSINGDGTFATETQNYSVSSQVSGIAVGDLNGDNRPDIAVSLLYSNSVGIFFGDGEGEFTAGQNVPTGSEPTDVALSDLDGDGDLDLVAANSSDDTVSVLLNNLGSFEFSEEIEIETEVGSVTLADLDADDDAELIVSGYGYGCDRISVLMGNGNGTFGSERTYRVGDGGDEIAVADIDGDDNLDIVSANHDNDYANHSVSVLLGNGDGTFATNIDYDLETGAGNVAVGDLDNDGDTDVVLSGYGFGSDATILSNLGDGTLAELEDAAVGSHVSLGDLDLDGDLDLVKSVNSNNLSVQLNNTVKTGGTSGGGREFTYDPTFNKLTSEVDEEGRQTLYELDPNTGNTLSVTRVVGEVGGGDDAVTRYSYNAQGQVKTETDPNGQVTSRDYDDRGNLIKVTFAVVTAEETYQQFKYDASGNQTVSIDENGSRTEYLYDELNRLRQTISAVGTEDQAGEQFEYDALGNKTAVVDDFGRTDYEYDELNRLVKIVRPPGEEGDESSRPVTSYEYDSAGNRVAAIDALGRRTEYRYDGRSRLVETIRPDGSEERRRYDFDNNPISFFDENDERTNLIYDARGRLIRKVHPSGRIEIYEYNAANELINVTDVSQETPLQPRGRFAAIELPESVALTDPTNSILYSQNADAGTEEPGAEEPNPEESGNEESGDTGNTDEPPVTTTSVAATTIKADLLWPGRELGLDLDGKGLAVGVWDGGDGKWKVRDTHQEFQTVVGGQNKSRVTIGEIPTKNKFDLHATQVAGIIGAKGVGDGARGIANQIELFSYEAEKAFFKINNNVYNIDNIVVANFSNSTQAGWTNDKAYFLARVQNDEDRELGTTYPLWNADYNLEEHPLFGKYAALTERIDKLLFDKPDLLGVWAAGNQRNKTPRLPDNKYIAVFQTKPIPQFLRDEGWESTGYYVVSADDLPLPKPGNKGTAGYDTLPATSVAKNSLVVGAVEGTSNLSIANFSTWGPTDDGRIKPDVVAAGTGIKSTSSGDDITYSKDITGTSFAAPAVTGAAALLIQHYQNLFFPDDPLRRQRKPLSATTKGLLIHTATDGGNKGPDYSFGWGLVDAAEAADFLTDVASSNPSTLLEENSYKGDEEWTMEVISNGEPLKATIVWTDPATDFSQRPSKDLDDPKSVLVNDLDMSISDPDGQTLHLPWVLDPANPGSPATRGNNNVDNVEQVLIEEPLEGEQYVIHVGHKGSIKDRLQNYSLLVSGVRTGVSIEASDPFANEHDGDPSEFVITRTGDTAEPLTVSYTVEGTAINGSDYEFLNNSITIPEGETQITIEINPLDDDLAEGAEDITLRLEPSDDYNVGDDNEASASIFDLDDDCNDETYGFCYC